MNAHWILKSSVIALIAASPSYAATDSDSIRATQSSTPDHNRAASIRFERDSLASSALGNSDVRPELILVQTTEPRQLLLAQANETIADRNNLIEPPKPPGKSPIRAKLRTPPELPEADPFDLPAPDITGERPEGVSEDARLLAETARQQALKMAREGQRFAAQVQRDVLRATEDIKRSARDGKRITLKMDGRQQARTLVLPSDQTSTEATHQTTEDLNVMHRIVAKAVGRRRDVEKFRIAFEPLQSPSIDALYLDGYGALFLISVNFPLVEPNQAPTAKPAADAKDPVWEETRRRVRTQNDDNLTEGFGGGSGIVGQAMHDFWNGDVEPYDAARVDKLQKKLTSALKHAANIRGLRPNETVTIVVTGPAVSATREAHDDQEEETLDPNSPTKRGYFRTTPGAAATSGDGTSQARESRLTLRAKKEDIDAVAEGKIPADQLPVKITKSGP